VAEFRRKLVLQERKFRHASLGTNQRSGDGLVVVVHTFNREYCCADVTAHGWTRSTRHRRLPPQLSRRGSNTAAGAASARNGRIRDVFASNVDCNWAVVSRAASSRNFHRGSCPFTSRAISSVLVLFSSTVNPLIVVVAKFAVDAEML
jgi:hypothetical protein